MKKTRNGKRVKKKNGKKRSGKSTVFVFFS